MECRADGPMPISPSTRDSTRRSMVSTADSMTPASRPLSGARNKCPSHSTAAMSRALRRPVHHCDVHRASREVPERTRQPEARLGRPMREHVVRQVHDAHAGVPDSNWPFITPTNGSLRPKSVVRVTTPQATNRVERCAQLAACRSPASRGRPQGKLRAPTRHAAACLTSNLVRHDLSHNMVHSKREY